MERNLITFSYHTEDAFTSGEFCNWKKCNEKLEKHQNSHCHKEAVEKLARVVHEKNDIGAQLDNQYRNEQDLHRRLFLKQLSSLKYLARQGLPLHGHKSLNGNLIQLLKTRSEDVPELNDWVRSGQYLSPLIINELNEMMGNTVLRGILKDTKNNSGLFSLLADESHDISNKEQLTCILLWVSLPYLEINEDFIGMYLIKKPDAETIAASLKDILLRCNLMLDDCRWQAYDGASTMSGHSSGVGARLQAGNPIAYRIHCANHRLDLVLKACANESKLIGDVLSLVQDLAVFIRQYPVRMSVYEDIAKECRASDEGNCVGAENLHLLCPTRWTVRTGAIKAVLDNYQGIYETLCNISGTGSTRDGRDKAAGIAEKMKRFATFLGLHFAMNLFSICEQLACTIQTKGILAETVMNGVKALKGALQRQRNDYSSFFHKTKDLACGMLMMEVPVLPRQKKVPRRLDDGSAAHHQFNSVEDMHRAQYFVAIDTCFAELNRRFHEESYAPLQQFESAIINAANGLSFELSENFRKSYEKDVNFDSLQSELNLLETVTKQACPEIKRVTSMETVLSVLSYGQNGTHLLPNVLRLMQGGHIPGGETQ
jgi:hypothetical protein